jgi:hypothetical protein
VDTDLIAANPRGRLRSILERVNLIAAVTAWAVSKLLDSLLLQRWRELSFAGAEPMITVDRPGSGLDIWLYYGLVALAVWAGTRFVQARTRAAHNIIAVGIVTAGLMLVGFLFSNVALIPRVRELTRVSGTVRNQQWSYYVFVRAAEDSSCWLQEPVPLLVDQSRRWRVGAHFQGRDEHLFEIIAIASAAPLHPVLLSSPGRYSCARIPAEVSRFVRIVRTY